MTSLQNLRQEIISHPTNAWAAEKGRQPIYTAHPKAKIVLIGQAPGRVAQESEIPWGDASGNALRKWMGITDEQFYDPSLVSLLPMDFYYPGKGKSGDLPPRKDFASRWHPPILEQMSEVVLTVLIGSYAQNYYLDSAHKNLTERVMNYTDFLPSHFPIVHPSPLNEMAKKKPLVSRTGHTRIPNIDCSDYW